MELFLNILDKCSPFFKHAIITFFTTLLMLLYIHTEFKSSFSSALAELNERLNKINNSMEKHIYTSEFKINKLESDLNLIRSQLDQAQQNILFLDRFMARAETHIAYSREKLGLKAESPRTQTFTK